MNHIADFALGKLTPEESLRVLDALERDSVASRRLDLVADIVRASAAYGEEIFESRLVRAGFWNKLGHVLAGRARAALAARWWTRPAFASAGAVVLILAALAGVSHLATSRYYPLTTIERLAMEPTTRGPVEAEYAGACRLVAQGKYPEAIRAFERFIRAYPGDDLRYLAEYSAGAANLLSAHHSIGPFFPSYDVEKVVRGLGHLQRAAENSSNGRITEEAHWLRAKGFLMLAEPAAAIAELKIVMAMNSSKREDAAELLTLLQELEGER